MLLVDSSVWIDQFRDVQTLATRFLEARDSTEEVALTAVIYLEVLQGATADRAFERIKRILESFRLLEPQRGLETYEFASQLYRRARRAGFTVRKTSDCLIAAIALEHGALLVHNDRDFQALARIEPRLQLYPGPPH
jgi:predicted nucleic acid-binding protein